MIRKSLLLLLLLYAAPVASQQFPTLAKGFIPEKIYQFNDIDHVNVYNGNLIITIPIGLQYPLNGGLRYGLTLTYNSKVWDVSAAGPFMHATPARRSNTGMGWLLSLGRLVGADDPTNDARVEIYESEDGNDHLFQSSRSGTSCISGPCSPVYTNDGSNLRLRYVFSNLAEVDFPDGSWKQFEKVSGTTDWRLTKIGSVGSNDSVTVTYPPTTAVPQCVAANSVWKIADTQDRIQYVCFKNKNYDGFTRPMADRAIVTTFGGSSTSYLFDYGANNVTVSKGIEDSDASPSWSQTHSVPLLLKVKLPDGTQPDCSTNDCSLWAMDYYLTQTADNGGIRKLTLPTAGSIDYEYSVKGIPSLDMCANTYGLSYGFGSRTSGVSRRTYRDALGNPIGTWTYTDELRGVYVAVQDCNAGGTEPAHPQLFDEMVVTIGQPSGDKTENHFSVWPGGDIGRTPDPDVSPAGFQRANYSLPYGVYDAGQNRYLSQEIFDCDSAGLNCSLPRSVYVRHENDGNCALCPHRLVSERTWYRDDPSGCVLAGEGTTCRFTGVELSGFDGYGHYRTTIRNGNLVDGHTIEQRTVTTNYNPGADLLGLIGDGSMLIPPGSNWVLNTYDFVDTVAGTTAREEYCFDKTTGFMKGRRTRKSAATTLTTDLLAVFVDSDGDGNVDAEKFYGGDIAPLLANATSVCDAIADPGPLGYQIDHDWQFGVMAMSSNSGASFKSLDLTIDATGLTASSRDTAGLATVYSYDSLGRLMRVAPPGEVETNITYRVATVVSGAFTPANAKLETISATAGTIRTEFQYDAFGRLWREKRLMPDGTTSLRETLYDGMSHRSSVSEWEKLEIPTGGTEYAFVPSHKSTFDGYDPFDRVGSITGADGRILSFGYIGARAISRAVNVATTASAETPVTTRETYDAFGRLSAVTENVDPDPSDGITGEVTTTYGYDVRNQLTTVTMPSDASTQTRNFAYDLRGLLLFEQHPELGVAGNGVTRYRDYDARGHAHRKTTGVDLGPFDLVINYDNAERVTDVRRKSNQAILKQFAYDDPTGATFPQCVGSKCNGKLIATARFNELGDLGTVASTENYQYDGVGGRVSRRDIAVGAVGSSAGESFFHEQSFNDAGQLATVTYPCRKVDAACDRQQPVMTNGYSNGFLSSVSGYATSIAYHANAMVATVTHSNGGREQWDQDANKMQRPAAVTLLSPGSVTLWSSGSYSYDGAGNVKQVGDTAYRYDPFGRLSGWTTTMPDGAFNSVGQGYDTYGNWLFNGYYFCGPTGPVRSCGGSSILPAQLVGTTNHYLGFTYDDAGNVVTDWQNRNFVYDSVGAMSRASVSGHDYRFLYTAEDERIAAVERVTGNDGITRNKTTYTLRGMDNELLSVWTSDPNSGAVSWKEDEIWRGATLLARNTATGVRHFAVDHLGSPRAITSGTGLLIGTQSFGPFGTGGTSDGGPLQFTAQERDAASLADGTVPLPDYWHKRYFDPQPGRFLSLDPLQNRDIAKPQLWNRYVYVRNNPLSALDRDGAAENKVIPPPPDETTARWTPEQRAAENFKNAQRAAAIERGEMLVVTKVEGSSILRALWEQVNGPVPQGMHVDHIIDRQLGGADTLDNAQLLDGSVNTSNGVRTARAIRGLPPGTAISKLGSTLLVWAPYVTIGLDIITYNRAFKKQYGRDPSLGETAHFLRTGDRRSFEDIQTQATELHRKEIY